MSPRDVIANTTWEDGERIGMYAADLILAALTAAGYAVVPREPTPHMVNRGLVRADIDWRAASEDEALSDDEARRIYRAMIAAAQEATDDAK